MSPYLKAVLSTAITVGLAFAFNRVTNGTGDPVVFIAASALWWATRAYYLAQVNTAHKSKTEA